MWVPCLVQCITSKAAARPPHSKLMNWHSEEVDGLVRGALAEDVGSGDATTMAIVRPGTPARASIISRQTLVCAGLALAENVFRALDAKILVTCLHNDGSFVEPGAEL